MDNWKQPDKGRQQQYPKQHIPYQSHKNQSSKTTSDHNSTELVTDPIQSIANVLNHHHSKFVLQNQGKKAENNKLDQATGNHHLQQQQQKQRSKGTNTPIQDCSHGDSNQVDQGNSYLYAYNDFVTSTRFLNKDSNPSNGLNLGQESLIESDEDDALSYILHQHRPQQDLLHDIQCLSLNSNTHHINNRNRFQHYTPYEESIASFEAHRIDHHLSCARSSHPRHICGIGGSHTDKLNNIAARLKEESQRAFVLNQKRTNYTDHDIASIQTRNFSHDLNLNNELHITSSGIENPAFDRQALLLESGDNKCSSGEIVNECSSISDQSRQPTSILQPISRPTSRARRIENPGYFSWLFCCLCNLLGKSTATQQKRSHRVSNVRKGRHKGEGKRANESSIVSMYTSSQQVAGVQQLGGQVGAYYATQAPSADAIHQSYSNHAHHHHYPLSSDSSLSSSAFANSAIRMNAFFRSCCSKKCLFVFCLILILLIFIFVIGLSAYLNFLINLNKTNLAPLSGRLKVDTQGDSFNDQLSNRTSKEFLAKQQQYETILRGAFDRTQNLLKSYPNHLVKCEVYSFKPGSLWIYFRLYINKKTLMHDTQLMKRKSPDEHLDRQFLPRLTQQTLHSGFEQLVTNFNREKPERRTRSSQTSNPKTIAALSAPSQRDHVKSFDDQISLLMPIIESIDLQSIQVTPEFDMLQSINSNLALQQSSMSDNLRASQFLTTAPSAVMVATGSNKQLAEYDIASTTTESVTSSTSSTPTTFNNRQQLSTSEPEPNPDEISVSTRKFTLVGYKENVTRPSTSSRPVTIVQSNSPFLVNHQHRKQTTSIPVPNVQSVVRFNGQSSKNEDRIVASQASIKNITTISPLTSGNFSSVRLPSNLSESNGFNRAVERDKLVNDTVVVQMVAPYQKIEFSSQAHKIIADSSNVTPRKPVQDTSIQELWNTALNIKKNSTVKHDKQPESDQSLQLKKLIAVTTVGERNQNYTRNSTPDSLERHHVSVLSPDVTNTIRMQLTSSLSNVSQAQPPKVSPPMKHGGSLIMREPNSAIVLNRDFRQGDHEIQIASSNSTRQVVARLPQQRRPMQSQRNTTSSNNDRLRNSRPKVKKITELRAKNETSINAPLHHNNQTINMRQNKNKTQEAFNFNADNIAPTLPTTIELTRSTSASPPIRTTSFQSAVDSLSDQRSASSLDYTTTTTTTTSSTIQKFSTPLSVITTTESPDIKLTPSSSINVTQISRPTLQATVVSNQITRPGSSGFSSQWRPIAANSTTTTDEPRKPNLSLILGAERILPTVNVPSNQGSQSPFAMSPAILENQLKPTSVSRQSGSRRSNKLTNTYHVVNAGSSSNEFESHRMSRMKQGERFSTISSLNLDHNTRIVDDFMITTDRADDNTRGSTLIPPLVLSGLQRIDTLPRLRTMNAVELQPKRTRGPFAFETLKTFTLAAPEETTGPTFSRLERSPNRQGADQKLLVRKKLFIGSEEDDDQSIEQTFRCPHYGCRAKGSQKFTCLNHTQICDDFIDCQDESDELDCVSLLKHDSKSDKLGFSNGGGIIYLNRKGSLAPMCIDYFADMQNQFGSTNLAQIELIKKQQELIRQINTIGQYACSLQSFSRLVSVKINHHNLVDDLNLIKSSKLYHRLSINSITDKRDNSFDASSGSYRSGSSEHEVDVSTSLHCPSQRTVFVKCGSFECGQDSFSIIDQNSSAKKKGEVIINDFPWLVKLYWMASLSCHGYLIDELWLIASSECFANKTRTDEDKNKWTAEISYEHYGNDDYKSIESNRRVIHDILVQPNDSSSSSIGASIVLAKLEKPVRFSPLNRPICLPPMAVNKTSNPELDKTYKDCVTATLPLANSGSPTQDLILSKVKVQKSTDCLKIGVDERLNDFVCVNELANSNINSQSRQDDATRVLICSTAQASRSRSKWTVVGVQNRAKGLLLDENKQLFTTVSSQIDWIVDTMNPKSYSSLQLGRTSLIGNELDPSLLNTNSSQNQTCNQFKCSSGECLFWSRICDGLYDCSSHDDEKDCHK